MSLDGFVRRESEGLGYYACRALEELSWLRHGFSTRHGGVSSLPAAALNLTHHEWDEKEHVEQNRQRLLGALGLSHARLITLRQIHSARVHIIREGDGQGNSRSEGDALMTVDSNLALAIQIADCFPVLLADTRGRAIGAAHSGWRGTRERIAAATVRLMHDQYGADPADMIAAIGPGIRACCFEVGLEVAQAFASEFTGSGIVLPHPRDPAKALLDLPRALAFQLSEAGAGRIFDLGLCTRCNPNEFFSYRGEGRVSGRMMGVIGRL